jgi:pre-mRNA-processing factor 19
MSFNICAISGNLVEEPVVSKITGHIYEKNIIEKYITNFGKCPISQKPMTENDLIKVNTQNFTRPKNIKENSVGGLFSGLQNGMMNLLSETNDLKKHVDNAREELSHSLYQYDASLRVITKLIKERDSIIQEINELKDEFEDIETEAYVNEESDFCGFYQGLINRIEELSMLLGKMRRERKTPVNYPNITKEGIKKYMRFNYENLYEEKGN